MVVVVVVVVVVVAAFFCRCLEKHTVWQTIKQGQFDWVYDLPIVAGLGNVTSPEG